MNPISQIKRLFKSTVEKIALGRWERTCEKKNKIKVYWANIDHCGTCSSEKRPEKLAKPKEEVHNKLI
jgi:hypothetical protein